MVLRTIIRGPCGDFFSEKIILYGRPCGPSLALQAALVMQGLRPCITVDKFQMKANTSLSCTGSWADIFSAVGSSLGPPAGGRAPKNSDLFQNKL